MLEKKMNSAEKLPFNMDTTTCIQDLIEERVVNSPDSIAVIFENQEFTYRELDNRANQLANHLQQLGLKPEMLVGICISRSFEMVVGILGTLKAGGAFVPLDPEYPSERLSLVLKDAGAQFLITQIDFLSVFPQEGPQVICLDRDWLEVSKRPNVSPQRVSSAENLAYVIYTSGSTGKPKGVMITHANLCNFVRIACSALDVRSEDIYLHTASIAYALSIRQMMIPLSFGATIVVASANQARDPLLLFDLIKRCEVSLIDVVPSFWQTCIQRLLDLPPNELEDLLDNSLRRIVSIGEPLSFDIPRDWRFKLGHQADLVNIFGQTETTGVVATYPIPNEIRNSTGIVPIGRSVPETELYILDSNFRPVTNGETGELCVSNPCISRGYLNRPELTAIKFIPNPFDDQCSERLYRTGDLARCRNDRNIEFLGRIDHQVKIRGQRLELGEVESVLREHPVVNDCVAIAQDVHPNEKYLVVYIVVASGQILVHNELREFMRQRVPDYMVPSDYVVLDAFPLTPNGKINRLALADPSYTSLKDRSENAIGHGKCVGNIQARSYSEQVIARIWQDLLKIDNIDLHGNFFDLGGHSLLAVRMFARIEQDLGVRLPLTSLFNATTVAQLSDLIENRNNGVADWSPIVPIQIYSILT